MLIQLLLAIMNFTNNPLTATIAQHGYISIFVLLVLEAASFPIPSEVVLPAVGYFAAKGTIDPVLGFAAAIVGGIVGMGIDYYIAYFFGKEVVYKHLHLFHIKKKNILAFDAWFARNGAFAVFVSRLLPIVRGLINFPAGFAEMSLKEFYFYSITGTVIWDVLLISFGYYALSVSNFYMVAAAMVAFTIVLYLVYEYAMRRIRGRK
jgi:membrane protein DedA with SNARE-associated domain